MMRAIGRWVCGALVVAWGCSLPVAISWWDLSDHDAWLGAPAGLLRKDMAPKPAYDRLVQLIRHDWWTDTSGASNEAGIFQTRAFYGEYVITVEDARGRVSRRTYSFPAGSGAAEVVVALVPGR